MDAIEVIDLLESIAADIYKASSFSFNFRAKRRHILWASAVAGNAMLIRYFLKKC